MRVKFIARDQHESEGRHKGPEFLEGEVYDFTDDFGPRFLHRGTAVELPSTKTVTENTFKPVTKVAPEHIEEPEPQPEPVGAGEKQPEPEPKTTEEPAPEPDAFDAMSDDELRAFVTERDNEAPHHRTGRDKLLSLARG